MKQPRTTALWLTAIACLFCLRVECAQEWQPTGIYAPRDDRTIVTVYMPTWCGACKQWEPRLVSDGQLRWEIVRTEAPEGSGTAAYPSFYVGAERVCDAQGGGQWDAAVASIRKQCLDAGAKAKPVKPLVSLGSEVTLTVRVVEVRGQLVTLEHEGTGKRFVVGVR